MTGWFNFKRSKITKTFKAHRIEIDHQGHFST